MYSTEIAHKSNDIRCFACAKLLFICTKPAGFVYGTPGPIRTADLCLRRALLYPTELRAHMAKLY